MLTSFADDDKVLPAVRAGAAGYLLKDVEPPELAGAIRTVHAGEALLAAGGRAACSSSRSRPGRRRAGRGEHLTPREREVLALVARGPREQARSRWSSASSERTVKTHVSNILGKLGPRPTARRRRCTRCARAS